MKNWKKKFFSVNGKNASTVAVNFEFLIANNCVNFVLNSVDDSIFGLIFSHHPNFIDLAQKFNFFVDTKSFRIRIKMWRFQSQSNKDLELDPITNEFFQKSSFTSNAV